MHSIDSSTGKADCRRILRAARKSLSDDQQQSAAQELLLRLDQLPDLTQFNRIAAYWAADGELSCTAVIQHLQQQGTEVLLPVIQDDKSLKFARYDSEDRLQPNRYGIPEPCIKDGKEQIPDGILMPLVGVDRKGHRLGMGGGFYDRTLARLQQQGHRPTLIGMAHDCQVCESLPVDDWDMRVDWVWTPSGAFETPSS